LQLSAKSCNAHYYICLIGEQAFAPAQTRTSGGQVVVKQETSEGKIICSVLADSNHRARTGRFFFSKGAAHIESNARQGTPTLSQALNGSRPPDFVAKPQCGAMNKGR